MKFARYLQETQTPEWKKAYIDYRGLKKRITAVRRAQDGASATSQSGSTAHLPINESPRSSSSLSETRRRDPASQPPDERTVRPVIPLDEGSTVPAERPSPLRTKSLKKIHRSRSRSFASRDARRPTTFGNNPFTSLPLNEVLPLLSPAEKLFFTALDHELEKIETFYQNQEKEMQARTQMLKDQLNELAEHRKRFYEVHPEHKQPWTSALKLYHSGIKSRLRQAVGFNEDPTEELKQTENILEGTQPSANTQYDPGAGEINKEGFLDQYARTLDPEEYHHAKKKLKKAVLEHYRALEALKNYRILNITGFRKALKKFEKFTKIPVQHAYMKEKVETSAFYSDESLSAMIQDMEEMYTLRFERGDRKKARARLRGAGRTKSHHFSTFRSGILLGLAVPALISGLYQSFRQETRHAIAGWDGLLLVYGILLIPVLFSLLVGLNVLVWSQARINYVFIFELDVRTRLDHREYFEIPAILFATLCYAFWLSFSRVGSPSVSPTIWPLVWLGFAALVIFDPFPFLFKPSRYWLVRNVGRLLISGTKRVEFTDFWMGDQFCSLVFTLSNLYLFVCVYARGFDDQWRRCSVSSPQWPAAFVLGSIPFFVRVVQSLRRYADSKLITHLINAGKYASGIVSYFFYFLWRHNRNGTSLALWCLFNAIYAIYASSWDLLMDWSVLRFTPDVKAPLLRPELVYTDNIPLYYSAIVSNVLIRFIWIFYIPSRGPNITLRTFIGGFLEMLRRWQWNFYRLENEHLGNVDQYRITREVPLPYSFDEASPDDEDEDDKEGAADRRIGWLFRRRNILDRSKRIVSDEDQN